MRAGVATAIGAGASIDQATSLGAVSLTVSDLARARAFYEQVLGLVPAAPDDGPGRPEPPAPLIASANWVRLTASFLPARSPSRRQIGGQAGAQKVSAPA